MIKKLLLAVLLSICGTASAAGWALNQVKIKHVQSGNSEYFYLSLSEDTKGVSECAGTWGADWGIIDLNSMTEKKRYMLTLAIAAQTSGALVDIGGTKQDCSASNVGELPIISFIRVGDFRG